MPDQAGPEDLVVARAAQLHGAGVPARSTRPRPFDPAVKPPRHRGRTVTTKTESVRQSATAGRLGARSQAPGAGAARGPAPGWTGGSGARRRPSWSRPAGTALTSSSSCSSDRGSNSSVLVTTMSWSRNDTVPASHSASVTWPSRSTLVDSPGPERDRTGRKRVGEDAVRLREVEQRGPQRGGGGVRETDGEPRSVPAGIRDRRGCRRRPRAPAARVHLDADGVGGQAGGRVGQGGEPQPARDALEREDGPLLAPLALRRRARGGA